MDPGAFRLRTDADGYATETIEVTVGPSPGAEIRVALTRGGRIQGRVVDSRGRSAAGVRIAARAEADEGISGFANSSADGAFEISGLRPGAYAIAGGSALAGYGVLTGVTPGATDVVLQLSPGGRIRVTASEGGETPVDGAFVSIRRVNGAFVLLLGGTGRTGEDGTGEVDSPAGLIEIVARKGILTGRGQVTVSPGGLATVEITLSAEAPPPAP
jgi:hypothetical protein